MKPTDLLWTDTGVYCRRLEKSAAALIAVERSLRSETHRVPGADGFLELYQWLSCVDAGVFTKVWSDPAAYYWVRRTVQFLAAIHGAPLGTLEHAYCTEVGASGILDALRIHLGEFKRFVLAAAMISGVRSSSPNHTLQRSRSLFRAPISISQEVEGLRYADFVRA